MMGQVARSPVWLRRTRPWRQESGVGSVRLDPGSAPLTSVVPNDLYTDILLDDIVLTHSLFLPTEKFLQELHQYFVLAGGREGPEGLGQKQACLAMLLHFLDTYQGLLQEEEGAGRIIKDLYLLIMKDESLYQDLREDTLRLHQLVETVELKIPEESQPPNKQVKPLFRHFRRIDSCLQTRVAFRGSDEIFCRVYMPDHSYVTIRSRLSASVQDILGSVTEKLQYSEEPAGREDSLILVAVASSGARFSAEKVLLQPTEDCVFTTLGINSHLFACTRDSYEALPCPLPATRCPSPRKSRSPLETPRSTEWSLRMLPTTLRPSTGSCSAVCTSWSSWTTCSTGSAAGGRRPTWSCSCSAAARSPTGWPRRCCSARPRASACSCSRSSSRSRPSASRTRTCCPSTPWSWGWTTRRSAACGSPGRSCQGNSRTCSANSRT
ncbi:PREDICTED: rap guanine nucleotide exchange factor-like 1 isoform X3 [Myotis davidii]|uniref:rap guanine nucleotide exchange factor-like 1 isoform X3 n=1 Tax=Myotis davidii TaxID=225400 RepID=UPI000767AA27|nr:PREDICTED: rap guanine nucleotide exchange factor-like 1 isoform X3 [Myotis davidii]